MTSRPHPPAGTDRGRPTRETGREPRVRGPSTLLGTDTAPVGPPAPALPAALAWTVLAGGAVIAGLAAGLDPTATGGAAAQDWPPFVLVTGLLLVGVVAAEDGVFDWAGRALEQLASGGALLYGSSMALVAVVTALLNLDTSVTFLTPVLFAAARHRRGRSGPDLRLPMLYGCLLMSNAASLLLPGSNLTNLIVLGHLRLSGGAFAARMAPAWLVASTVTALVVGVAFRRRFTPGRPPPSGQARPAGPRPGLLGSAGVLAATALVVTLRSPALAVLATGVAVVLLRETAMARSPAEGRDRRQRERGGEGRQGEPEGPAAASRRGRRNRRLLQAAGGPVLPGLFGIAVGAGVLGRAWHGPAWLLAHVSAWLAAPLAAVLSVLLNNLPAASLLAARQPSHPFSVLLGLDIGPNLLVTGSLSSILWWQQARLAGARPSAWQVSRLGLLAAPLAMAGAIAVLVATGSR